MESLLNRIWTCFEERSRIQVLQREAADWAPFEFFQTGKEGVVVTLEAYGCDVL
jgi:hypothetical protein